jgi:predicted N-acetyltransferase YhbS
MTIDKPTDRQVSQLWDLWREAFGDSGEFLNDFFETAFSPERCLCATGDGRVVAAVYWFDCELRGKKIAYLYALATAMSHRGHGIAHILMERVHSLLTQQGYEGVILVPGKETLFSFYESMGYRTCTRVGELVCSGAPEDVQLRRVTPAEYAKERRALFSLIEPGGVLQEGENLAFLATQAELYIGQNCLLAAIRDGNTLIGLELLGDHQLAPGIVQTLGYAMGCFRIRGQRKPFAMYLPLGGSSLAAPTYFGLAFD